MADVEKIAAELRERAEWRAANEGPFTKQNLVEWRAADELSRLRDALKPFAAWAEKLEREFSDHDDTVIAAGIHGAFVTFGDLRRARALSTQVEERE